MRGRVNESAVFEYFMFRAISGEQSLFKGVKSLLPGHHMTIDESGIHVRKYWDEHAGSDPKVEKHRGSGRASGLPCSMRQ